MAAKPISDKISITFATSANLIMFFPKTTLDVSSTNNSQTAKLLLATTNASSAMQITFLWISNAKHNQ